MVTEILTTRKSSVSSRFYDLMVTNGRESTRYLQQRRANYIPLATNAWRSRSRVATTTVSAIIGRPCRATACSPIVPRGPRRRPDHDLRRRVVAGDDRTLHVCNTTSVQRRSKLLRARVWFRSARLAASALVVTAVLPSAGGVATANHNFSDVPNSAGC